MSLFMKQDFTPPVLSRKWFAFKSRPNLLLYNRQHIISILESGLLFREDSIEVEQEAPCPESVWNMAGGGRWLTTGERVAAIAALGACVLVWHPTSVQRSSLLYLAGYLSVPVVIRTLHRSACRRTPLAALLQVMRDYLTLARRAAACVRESAVLHQHLGSMSNVISSTQALLCRQQAAASLTLWRASSALLGNVPWLRADVAWDAVTDPHDDNLMKIHHTFLVVQSAFLKHVAMAHFIPPAHSQRVYKNYNERIYWIHNVLLQHIYEELKDNYEALDRMYRLLKNFGSQDNNNVRIPGVAINDSWLYSDVHGDVARACLELKVVLNKCTKLDTFLDTCAINNQEFDLDILDKDIDDVVDGITKCLATAQSSQIRLKKLKNKFGNRTVETIDNESSNDVEEVVLKVEDTVPETKDEVFYLMKTEDDKDSEPLGDTTTGPGAKETETTKLVLNELKRKLVKREDTMRERERQALANTMPELKNNFPEFPRQMTVEPLDRKGFIHKIRIPTKRKVLRKMIVKPPLVRNKSKKYVLNDNKYEDDSEIKDAILETNNNINAKNKLLTVGSKNEEIVLTRWHKKQTKPVNAANTEKDYSSFSDGLSDEESNAANGTVNEAVNPHSKQDAYNAKYLRRKFHPSSSESDEFYKDQQIALLRDIRRHRASRKKNFPAKKVVVDIDDEGLKPVEYSLGAGIAMASVLQVNGKAKVASMLTEEVFTGDGEVSEDSGNDEDA